MVWDGNVWNWGVTPCMLPHSICKNKRLTEIEIQPLWKEIQKDDRVPERIDAVLEMSYGGMSGTKTVREQCCNLED